MELLDFSKASKPRRGNTAQFKLILGFGVLAGFIALGSTLASNINLNSGAPIEFGQGVAATTACDGAITLFPLESFSNATGGGTFTFSGLKLSNLDTTVQGCAGKTLSLEAHGQNGSSLSNFAITISSGGSFSSADGILSSPQAQGATSGVTLTFPSPKVDAKFVYRITIQSASRYTPNRGIELVPMSGIYLSEGLDESGNFTIEGWVRSSDWSQANALIPYVANTYGGVILQSTSSSTWTATVNGYGYGITFTLPESTAMPKDQWLYWVFVKDESGDAMFIDGVKLNAVSNFDGGSTNLPISASSDKGEIGQWSYYDPWTWHSNNGVIGELRLSNIARVASTAASLNPTYASGGQPNAQLQSDANTVMLLEPPASGAVFTDSSGNQILTVAMDGGGSSPIPQILNFK